MRLGGWWFSETFFEEGNFRRKRPENWQRAWARVTEPSSPVVCGGTWESSSPEIAGDTYACVCLCACIHVCAFPYLGMGEMVHDTI